MRRFMAWFTVLTLVASAAGCYKGRGICDCLDYRDPCCYGCYCYGPCDHCGPADGHLAPLPPQKAEPLKVMPKEIEKAPAKDLGKETAAPAIP
jgi:hypothetical protein